MTTTKKRPILMSTPMIIAMNADLKTQTRRTSGLERFTARGRPTSYETVKGRWGVWFGDDIADDPAPIFVACPYGGPGGELWVREGVRRGESECDCDQTFDVHPPGYHDVGCASWPAHYIADGRCAPCDRWLWKNKALPAIHMPRGMCRYELLIEEVRVERLQTITEADAIAEGVTPVRYDHEGDCWTATEAARKTPHRVAYEHLWGQLHGPESWAQDPYVWRLVFKPRRIR